MKLIKHIALMMFLAGIAACATAPNQGSPSDAAALARAKAHTDLGAAYFQQNKLEVALGEFAEAIQAYPNYPLAYNGMGLVRAALGENAEAEANFKKAIQLQPNSSESHNNYGNFLCNTGRYDESIVQFMDAVKNPLYSTPNLAYANAGICSARKKDFASAEAYLNKALQLNPLTHSAAYQLAEIQFARGNAESAQKTLQNALVSGPGPEVLWLGIRIARAMGNKDDEASYALQLRRQYPNSEQTRLLLSGQ
ncbi:MAG TPA: type IV pilus biogenesis/stability protein PilW [Methylophilus sp.]|nr:type IV pilus biogenesis/stability protein PilW [Methylophilus sp.]HQQ33947.1 type IV pilus biogenesis/stability protein PilW [Methylophilus sp.]